MTALPSPRFNSAALRALAGDAVFKRGEAYCANGAVEILGVDGKRVLARVAGSENYRTVVTGRRKDIGGECSCPAFEDWGFCKHMVATALAANALDPEAQGDDVFSRIAAHLRTKTPESLIQIILAEAETDPVLLRKLDLATAAAGNDPKTLENRLRRAIDGATRVRDFIEYREAEGWAADVEAALDAIEVIAGSQHAAIALTLALRAVDRIEQALERIDDSDGHGSALLEQACRIHRAAAETAKPDPVVLARELFRREMQDGFGSFHDAVQTYADVLGEAGPAEYRRLSVAAWEKLPPRSGPRRESADGHYDRLKRILDVFAEREGDIEARIALRAKDLTSPWHYQQLAAFCAEQGRDEQALSYAEEGLWIFEDESSDDRLVVFCATLLLKAGRAADAGSRLWRAFEKQPSQELYDRLRQIGGIAARDRALQFLQARLGKAQRSPWYRPADFYIRILIQEKLYDQAWAAVHAHGASTGTQETLARACEKTHSREALRVYEARVAQLAEAGGNKAYEEVVSLIARMAALRKAREHAAYVEQVKAQFGRKRNLMKLLA